MTFRGRGEDLALPAARLCLCLFFSTSRGGRALLRVRPGTRRRPGGAGLCAQPPLVAELREPGSLRARLPGRIQQVAVRTTER